VIELAGITRTFRVGGEQVRALRQVDLAIGAGDYVAVMGPSGSGKSTLLNIIGLLDRPDSGTYHLEREEVGTLQDQAQAAVRLRKIGFVFQFFHLVPRLTAAENVALPLVLAGVEPVERRQRVSRILASLGLADRSRHRPDQLSGGQRQRVAIARATIMEPRIILADEPTGNLDRASGQEVIRILEDHNAHGITLVLVTHDPELGRRARRRVNMQDGAIAAPSS
jgi:putative ABC transport system ATP-binding protein